MSTKEEDYLIIDLFGPIIDISKFPMFFDVPHARHLSEKGIADYLTMKNGSVFDEERVQQHAFDIMKDARLTVRLVDEKTLFRICAELKKRGLKFGS